MVYRYVPIIRWKAGERTALSKLSAPGRSDVTPLVIVAPDQFVGKKKTAKVAAVPSPAHFVQLLLQAWGREPVFVDASAVPATATGHPLASIGHVGRALGTAIIPATTLAASPTYQAAVASLVSADGRGVALRIDLQDMTNAGVWISAWPYRPEDTDLIVDLEGTVAVAHSLGAAIDPAFQGLLNGTRWRSVTLAGSSMPANFTGLAAGLYRVPRTELALWQRLSAVALPYRLDFGDYATVSTEPAPSGIAWGFPINAKYTLKDEFLICRGVRTKGLGAKDMDVQLIGHAGSIVGHPTRGPIPHCWADGRIDQIASKTIGPSGLPGWVGYAVNRHIEATRAHLP